MNPTDAKPVGLLVLLPSRGTPSIETALCLREQLDGFPNVLKAVFRKPAEVAANQLFHDAREIVASGTLPFKP